ncbi:MAG: DNA polymerase I, partial [candidate division WOR-3 bacterium]
GVVVYDPYKEKQYEAKDVKERLGVMPEEVPDFLALAGDATDNIPGVPGIGPKRALEIIVKYGTLDEALKRDDRLKGFAAEARLSRQLAEINTDAKVGVEIKSLLPREPDRKKLMEIYRQMEFYSLLRELQTTEVKRQDAVTVREVLDSAELAKLSQAPCGFSFEPGKGFWISADGKEAVLVSLLKKEEIKPYLEQSLMVGFDVKGELLNLHRQGLDLIKRVFDVGVGAWLLDPNRKRYLPEDVISQVLGDEVEVSGYPQRAVWAWRVYKTLLPEIQARGLFKVATELEMPLIFVLARMEERGVKIDPVFFKSLAEELTIEQEKVKKRIYELAGVEFNIGSPRQLSTVLFERLKLSPGKRTKTGYSTGQNVLEDLRGSHPIIDEVLRYRELGKLLSTYLQPLCELVSPETGRVHTKFNQCGTATGRLSSSEPNLQNIPIRGELGKKVRQGFVADEGMMLISADYSQIELRVLAHLAGDERLIAAFTRGEDIHQTTAAEILGIPFDEVSPEQRRIAKMVNYGLIYGMGDYGLSSRTQIPIEQARAFMEEYFHKFPGVARWRERTMEEAKRDGLVKTISGRIRPVPGVFSENRQVVEASLRAALNAPVQGSAADIIKRAMIRLDENLQERRLGGGIILQIHDELLIEVEQSRVEEAKEIVKREMENAWHLQVPLVVEIGVGKNWGEADGQ